MTFLFVKRIPAQIHICSMRGFLCALIFLHGMLLVLSLKFQKMAKFKKIHSLQSSSDIRIRILAALTYGNRHVPGGVWTVKHSGGLERITAAAFLQKYIF